MIIVLDIFNFNLQTIEVLSARSVTFKWSNGIGTISRLMNARIWFCTELKQRIQITNHQDLESEIILTALLRFVLSKAK